MSTLSTTIAHDRINHSTATRLSHAKHKCQNVVGSSVSLCSAASTTRIDARPEYSLQTSIAPGHGCPARRAA